MWRYVQTAAWPQPDRNLNRNLTAVAYIFNNGDVVQTAAVRTAAVCLGPKSHYRDPTCTPIPSDADTFQKPSHPKRLKFKP